MFPVTNTFFYDFITLQLSKFTIVPVLLLFRINNLNFARCCTKLKVYPVGYCVHRSVAWSFCSSTAMMNYLLVCMSHFGKYITLEKEGLGAPAWTFLCV